MRARMEGRYWASRRWAYWMYLSSEGRLILGLGLGLGLGLEMLLRAGTRMITREDSR